MSCKGIQDIDHTTITVLYRKIELKIYGDLEKSSEVMARINRLASVILACLVSLPRECGRTVESKITLMILLSMLSIDKGSVATDKINFFSNIFSGQILNIP